MFEMLNSNKKTVLIVILQKMFGFEIGKKD